MWLWLGIILGLMLCFVLLFKLLSIAVKEDDEANKKEKVVDLTFFPPTLVNFKDKLTKIYQDIKNGGEYGDHIVFRRYTIEWFDLKRMVEGNFETKFYVYEGVRVHQSFRPTSRCFLFNPFDVHSAYGSDYILLDYSFFYDGLDDYMLVKSNRFLWNEFVDATGPYFSALWYKIDGGEYYTNFGIVHRFKDWLEVSSFEDWFVNNRDNLKGRIELCKNPREEHWEHFLDLEIKAKKDRLQQCKEWVDTVLKKQQKYNDICLINEVATTPLIHDYETLKNFCNMSGEKVKFEEYEITNYLLIIRNTLTKV